MSTLTNDIHVHPTATDDEDWTNGYPIATKYKEIMDDIAPRWRATPLPAFHPNKKFIDIAKQEVSLRGALVLVHFKLRHYPIRNKRTNGVAGNTFSATATLVKILVRPVENQSSQTHLPTRASYLNAQHPSWLPNQSQSREIRKEPPILSTQVWSCRQLQISTEFSLTAVTDANISTAKTSISHAEGKKRALDNIVDPDDRETSNNPKNPDEDNDATTTETESPTAEKNPKKRKTIIRKFWRFLSGIMNPQSAL